MTALDIRSRVLFTASGADALGAKYSGQHAVVTMRLYPDNNIRFDDGTIIWAESSELSEVTE